MTVEVQRTDGPCLCKPSGDIENQEHVPAREEESKWLGADFVGRRAGFNPGTVRSIYLYWEKPLSTNQE